MSHRFKSNDGFIFNYNPDLSGDVRIHCSGDDGKMVGDLHISGVALKEFILYYLQQQKIAELGNMNQLEFERHILGI